MNITQNSVPSFGEKKITGLELQQPWYQWTMPIQVPQTYSQSGVYLWRRILCQGHPVHGPCHECMHALYTLASPAVVCPFMHAKCLAWPDHHHSPTRPLWSDLYQPAIPAHSLPKEHKSNPMFHLCVCVSSHPLRRKPRISNLHQSNVVFSHTSTLPEKSIQIIIGGKHKLSAIFHFFFFSFFLTFSLRKSELESREEKKGMTMLNISCFPLGNSVQSERDLVFHRNMSNSGTDCGSLVNSVFLYFFS